ncbi:ATP-binding protein [Pseudomonas sp. NPDC090202]|uniref:ATP-binding protein n=1 Tax=unclassified Pseudomonas TaxID=196821 RepID=UPI00380BA503
MEQWPLALKIHLNQILNSPESMYLLWGPDLLFFHNDVYAPILGPRLTSAMGMRVQELWSDVWDQVRPFAEKALRGEPWQCDDMPLTMARYGEIERTWWSFSFSPLIDEHNRIVGLLCVTRETTQRIVDQRALRASEQQQADDLAARSAEEALRQSQKMEAVGQLTGGLAHDFNNLLMGISGNIELMKNRVAKGRTENLDRYIDAALEASRRAAALTHRLLAFSRRQTLDPKPTDVDQLIDGMAELIRRTVGPSIAMDVIATRDLWSTLVDPHQLENALLNLCLNARDAMPDGGQLLIETANKRLDKPSLRDLDLPRGDYVALCVSDNGSGMSQEVVKRAFDPFFTTKPTGMGTGLGLSMIYGFAHQSGGGVHIDSTPGKGSQVCIYLPAYSEAVPVSPVEPDVQKTLSHRAGGETVLVVDDEPAVRTLVVEVLVELGYHVLEADHGAAALRVLQSSQTIDLLMSDVGLPGGMNGRQLADAARSLRPKLKVLFVTGYAENAALDKGRLEPGMHVLTKPFSIPALSERVKALLER